MPRNDLFSKLYRRLREVVRRQQRILRFKRTYTKFHDFTMIPSPHFVNNLVLAERLVKIQGCIVECGVWRGGMSAGIASVLGPEREYYLFDSFEGLPAAKDVDGSAALRWQSDTQSPGYFDNCTASPEYAQRAMTLAGARRFHLVKGWFNDTLSGFVPPSPIALLRLDADWYDSTMICLQSLFDFVCPGGLIILDDYYTWDGCSRALHDFLSKRSATERICSHGMICFLEKKAANNVASKL